MNLIVKAVLIGCTLTGLPQLLASLPTEAKAVQILHELSSYLLTPGVTACMVFNSWRVRRYEFRAHAAVQLRILFRLAFLVLWLRRRRTKGADHQAALP